MTSDTQCENNVIQHTVQITESFANTTSYRKSLFNKLIAYILSRTSNHDQLYRSIHIIPIPTTYTF
jgi:hypothetical protein